MNHPYRRFFSLLLVLCLFSFGVIPASAEESSLLPDSTVVVETSCENQEQVSLEGDAGPEAEIEPLVLVMEVHAITAISAEITFIPQGVGEIRYIVLEASENAPDTDKIWNEGETAFNMNALITGLAPAANYDIYGILASGTNISPVAIAQFTTAKAEEAAPASTEVEIASAEELPAGADDVPAAEEEPAAKGAAPVVEEEPASEGDVPVAEEEPAAKGADPVVDEEPAGESGLTPAEDGPALSAAMLMPMEESAITGGEPAIAISVNNITGTGAEVAFVPQGVGEIRYLVLEASQQAPDDAAALSSGATAQDNLASLTSLTSETEYAVYAVLDQGEFVSDIVTARFTALAGAVPLTALVPAYDSNDVAAINNLLAEGGWGYNTDDPANWDFVKWNDAGRAVEMKHSFKRSWSFLNVSGLTALEKLDLSGSYLVSITVSGLTSLKSLNCSGSNVTLLSVSGLTALESIDLSNSRIMNMDASGLAALKSLDCSGRQMSRLYVSGLTSLETLDCSGNSLPDLNTGGLTALKYLDCSNNRLENLNVSGRTTLENLNCSSNQLSSLDIIGLTALKKLDCHDNRLTGTLDVSKMTALNELDLGQNSFTGALDASALTALKILSCQENQFTGLKVNGLASLKVLFCANNKLTSLDVGGLTALEELNCFGNGLTSLDVHTLTSLKRLECSENDLTGTLDVSGLKALEFIGCYANTLTNLKLDGLTALKRLKCSGNNLSGTFNVSALKALNELECFSNNLTGLTVGGLTVLTYLDCSSNKLTGTLNVTGLIALEYLDCSSNVLSGLDVSGLTALTYINCVANQLTNLNVSGLTALIQLNCSGNKLSGLIMSGAASLEWLDCSGNQLSTLDLSGTVMKYLWCQNNYLASKELIIGLNESQLTHFSFHPQYTVPPTNTPAPTNTPVPTPTPTPVPDSITLSRTEITIAAGQTVHTVTATVSPSEADGTVTYASGNSSIASVSADGNITGVNIGSTVVNVTTVNGLTRVCIVTVVKAGKGVTGIAVSKSAASIDEGKTLKLSAKLTPRSPQNKTVSWSSDNSSVARVDGKGTVYGVSPGIATVTATASSGISAACIVTVNSLAVTQVILNKYAITLVEGKSASLKASVMPKNARFKALSWSSSNPAVASATQRGAVKGISPGTCTITATAHNGVSASCTVNVMEVFAKRLSLNKRSASVYIGSGFSLTARITPSNTRNKTIVWTSSNPSVAEVSSNGYVQTHAVGTAVLTAATVNGLTAVCRLTVKPILVSRMTISQRRATVLRGHQLTLSATTAPGNATNGAVTWISSKPAVAVVDQNGVVTGVSAGKATITCAAIDGSRKKAACTVTVP